MIIEKIPSSLKSVFGYNIKFLRGNIICELNDEVKILKVKTIRIYHVIVSHKQLFLNSELVHIIFLIADRSGHFIDSQRNERLDRL